MREQDEDNTVVECLNAHLVGNVQDSLLSGLVQLCVLMVLMSLLVALARVNCCFVWGIMIVSLLFMIFCRMPYLWMVVASCFVVSFYVGCQTGNSWLTVSTKFSVF